MRTNWHCLMGCHQPMHEPLKVFIAFYLEGQFSRFPLLFVRKKLTFPMFTVEPLLNLTAMALDSESISFDDRYASPQGIYPYEAEKSNPIPGALSKACGIHDKHIGNGSQRRCASPTLKIRPSMLNLVIMVTGARGLRMHQWNRYGSYTYLKHCNDSPKGDWSRWSVQNGVCRFRSNHVTSSCQRGPTSGWQPSTALSKANMPRNKAFHDKTSICATVETNMQTPFESNLHLLFSPFYEAKQ